MILKPCPICKNIDNLDVYVELRSIHDQSMILVCRSPRHPGGGYIVETEAIGGEPLSVPSKTII